ncbi:MAG: recombinase family protein [Dermatophilaceae bacterium]|nr:recombinase family protein [Dermatophilaceae bacterium]
MTTTTANRAHQAAFASPVSPLAFRATALVVVRESDEHQVVFFDGMREQTYQMIHIPEIDAVRALGLSPMYAKDTIDVTTHEPDGRARVVTIKIERIQEGATKALLFEFGGYWHLWSMASATRLSDSRENEFTTILTDTIRRLCPHTIYVANIGRLVRSTSQQAKIQDALIDRVDRIVTKQVEFKFDGANRPFGLMMFMMMAISASMERDWIVQRTAAGRVAQWRRDAWPFGAEAVPYGYRFGKGRRVVIDPEQRELIRNMLNILAMELPPAERVRRLGEAGLMSKKVIKRFGQRVSVDGLSRPEVLVGRLYALTPVWTRGEFLHRTTNPFHDAQEVAGVPVMRASADDPGELQLLYRLDLPDGGWADEEVLRMVEEQAVLNHASVAAGRSARRPLSVHVRTASGAPHLHEDLFGNSHLHGKDVATKRRRAGAYAKRLVAALGGRSWGDDAYRYEMRVHGDHYNVLRWPTGTLPQGSTHIGSAVPLSLRSQSRAEER